jgi:RHS repeat-associated protein
MPDQTNCFMPMTIDSLNYLYMAGSNKLYKIEDKVPCMDVLTLPSKIERDMKYAANHQIIVDSTNVMCNANLVLTTGLGAFDQILIKDKMVIPTNCASSPLVIANRSDCPDEKYSLGFNQQSSQPYQYDASGNTIYDPNKKLTFYYNYINLPYKIVGDENDELQMLYSADGMLLQRKYIVNNIQKYKRDYIGNKEWLNDTLNNIYFTDGRILLENNSLIYEYNIKDHLGNVRVSFIDSNNDNMISNDEVTGKTDYYAFGMKLESPWKPTIDFGDKNRLSYISKELVTEMNYNNLLFGARDFDPAICRFKVLDAFSANYISHSGFAYGLNNPIKLLDPDGNDVVSISGGLRFTGSDAISAYNLYTGKYKNALVYIEPIEQYRKEINSKDKIQAHAGWAVFGVSNFEQGAKLTSFLPNKSLNNLILSNHGNSNNIFSLFQFDGSDEALSSKNSFTSEDILHFNMGTIKEDSPQNKSLDAILSMIDKVRDGGNCLWGFCSTGRGSAGEFSLNQINEMTKNRVQNYLPTGKVGLRFIPYPEYGRTFSPNYTLSEFKWITKDNQKADFRYVNSIKINPFSLTIK